jgi:hypothetical protein
MKQKTRLTGFQWSMLISTANDEAYVKIYLYSLLMKNKWYLYGGCSSKEFVFNIFNCSVFYMYNSHTFCFIQMIFLVHDIPNQTMKPENHLSR